MNGKKFVTKKEAERVMLQRMASESQEPRTEEERRLSEERWKRIDQAIERERAARE